MIRYILNKTAWKDWDEATQAMLYDYVRGQTIIYAICGLVWYFIFIFTQIPCFVYFHQGNELKTTTGITLMCYTLICIALYLFAQAKLSWPLDEFSKALAYRMIYWFYTKKGKALSKSDFKTILRRDPSLFVSIATSKCRGHCYSVCFDICKALEKGSLEFVAIKEFVRRGKSPKNEYTMHVLYVHGGWAFDTYSASQFHLEKFHEIQKARVCRNFTFEDIKGKTYEQFEAETSAEIRAWAAANDCETSW